MKTEIYLFLIILFILPGFIQAQFSISGKIISADKQEVLTGANIVVKDSYLATSSDSKGNFVLKNLKAGNLLLIDKLHWVRKF